MSKSYSIYISSTQTDLLDERSVVKKRLERAGYLVRCMEMYPSFSEHPLDYCRADIESNADIYVCIVGDKYGSEPEIRGIKYEKSFTEYEYEAAQQLRLTTLAFIRKKDRAADPQKLVDFLNRLRTNHGVTEFSDENDLAAAILESLSNALGQAQKKGIPDSEKYFCNRWQQKIDFEEIFFRKRAAQHIHFFLLTGHYRNGHLSFVERYKQELKSKNKNREPLDIDCFARLTAPFIEEAFIEKIKAMIRADINNKVGFPDSENINADALFNLMLKRNDQYLFINLIVESTYINAIHSAIYKTCIERFYNNFTLAEEEKFKDRKIIFFLHLKYRDNPANEQIVRETFEQNKFYEDKKLSPLDKVNIGDIEEWLTVRNIETNSAKIDGIINEKFRELLQPGDDSFFLEDAEIKMDEVIAARNQKILKP